MAVYDKLITDLISGKLFIILLFGLVVIFTYISLEPAWSGMLELDSKDLSSTGDRALKGGHRKSDVRKSYLKIEKFVGIRIGPH